MPNFSVPLSDSAVEASGLIVRAALTNPTNATDGAEVGALADKAGRIVVSDGHVRDLCKSQQTTISASTAETTIVTAGAAGVFNDLTALIITTINAVAATLTLKDGTGGTTKAIFNYPNAAVAPGSPLVIQFRPPLSQAAAATNWTLTASVNASSFNITAEFIQNT